MSLEKIGFKPGVHDKFSGALRLLYNTILGETIFTENFLIKENKAKMRNIDLRIFHLLF